MIPAPPRSPHAVGAGRAATAGRVDRPRWQGHAATMNRHGDLASVDGAGASPVEREATGRRPAEAPRRAKVRVVSGPVAAIRHGAGRTPPGPAPVAQTDVGVCAPLFLPADDDRPAPARPPAH